MLGSDHKVQIQENQILVGFKKKRANNSKKKSGFIVIPMEYKQEIFIFKEINYDIRKQEKK